MEPDIQPLFSPKNRETHGMLRAFPRFNTSTLDYEACLIENADRDLCKGRFGIMEPRPECRVIEKHRLDLLLIPGIGFNTEGVRLGHGNGYYDRMCMKIEGVRIGIAFDQQVVPLKLPMEQHDIPMDGLLTPAKGIRDTTLGRGNLTRSS